ncbi:MAG: heavy metal translocating P-type ATPase [Planctomycetota bacterium]
MTTLAAQPTAEINQRIECAHCGLDVPAALFNDERDEQFCCIGCEMAFDTILACGLDEYYALRDKLGGERQPANAAESRFTSFNDPEFAKRHVKGEPDGSLHAEVYLEGVHCAACLWLVEKLPEVVPGLLASQLDLGRRTATLRWDPAHARLSEVAHALSKFGYTPHPIEPSEAREARRAEDRGFLIRIGIAAACAGNVMLLAFALYSGRFDAMDHAWQTFFRWLSAGIGVVSLAGPGRVFFRGALGALRARTWHLDTPIAIALLVGGVAGLVNVVRGAGEIYFDSLTMLVFLLLIGRWLQAHQQARAADAVELLFSVTPRSATRIESGQPREIAIESVQPGDLIEVAPQDCIPVDGRIEQGVTSVDESILTGESCPIERSIGDDVAAGSVNLGALIRVRTSAAGRDTRVGRLMSSLASLSGGRAPIVGQADRLAGPFVMVVLALAFVCMMVRLASGAGLEAAIESTIALLIVCCPCAIALATPLACAVATGKLASRGALVKGGHVFEALARPSRLVLDKTGTVTEGRFEVRDWIGDESARPAVAALERGSTHPVARALSRSSETEPPIVDDIQHHLGLGVTGTHARQRYAVGSATFMQDLGIDTPAWATDAERHASERAMTPVLVARGAEVISVVTLGDRVRPEAVESIQQLRALGMRPQLLSGDDQRVTAAIAAEIGLDTHEGRVDPEGKASRVLEWNKGGPVVVVGDGVNDAAALASGTVGVAVHGGAEASLAAADVYLSKPGLRSLVSLVRASRATAARVRLCLIVAASYNATAAALAIVGWMSPVVAAIVMPISSITVVAMALGVRWKDRAE